MSFQRHLHVEVYYNAIIEALQSKDGRESTLDTLKRVGVVAGGAVLGSIFLGPIGLVIGSGIGGAGAHEMRSHDEAYEAMLDFLRTLNYEHKDTIVSKVEDLVEDTDTDILIEFAKFKQNRERLLNLVLNYLIDNFNYKTVSHRTMKECSGGYQELSNMAAMSVPNLQMPRVGNKELTSLYEDGNWGD